MGFGEHKVRLPVDHPDSLDIYELCGKLGWVVLLHFEYRNYNYNFEVLTRCSSPFPIRSSWPTRKRGGRT